MNESACGYCGLPIRGTAACGAATSDAVYCCLGCRFAASIFSPGASESGEEVERGAVAKLALAVFFSMSVMVFTLVLWSQGEPSSIRESSPEAAWYDLARYACLLFTAPVVLLLSRPLIEEVASKAQQGKKLLSVLLLLGVAASLALSIVSLFTGGHVYFEVACTILIAATLGRVLEATGKKAATEALRGLAQLMPDEVRIVRDGGEVMVPAESLLPGDLFRVLAGERIAADGEIVDGEASVDEQTITGESLPVSKRPGDTIQSGCLSLDGTLTIRAASKVGDGALARIVAAVQGAAARSRYERISEKISGWFLTTIGLVAVLTFAAHAWKSSLGDGLLAAVAVIVIACPCALGLATPMALWAAIGRAAGFSVLIRDADAFLQLARVKTLCLDKTGTLTTGAAQIEEFVAPLGEETIALRIAATLADQTKHPLAFAIAAHARSIDDFELQSGMSQIRNWPGRGVAAEFDAFGGPAILGSRRWVEERGWRIEFLQASDDDGVLAESFVAWGGVARGRFTFREALRPHVVETLMTLKREGMRLVILSGDRQRRVATFAKELEIEFRPELLPEQKQKAIDEFRALGPVAMLGDGINDAPALAAADVGIALGSGADISRHTAGVCLLGDDLSRLPPLRELARLTRRTIHWNLIWAFAYNVLGIGFAASGRLHPIVAALAMGISGALVTANSLRLARRDATRSTESFAFTDASPIASPIHVTEAAA